MSTFSQSPDDTPRRPGGAPQPNPATKRVWALGQRRRFIVDRRQLRTTFLVGSVVTIVLAVLLVSLHVSRERTTEALVTHEPTLASALEAQNSIDLKFQIASALVFLCMVVVVTLLETHKTAGAAFNLRRQMRRVRDGEYGTRATLRRGDNLQSLGHAFNEMAIALDERLWQEIEVLDGFAQRLRHVSDAQEARQLADLLDAYVDARRQAADRPASDELTPPDSAVHDQVPVPVHSD